MHDNPATTICYKPILRRLKRKPHIFNRIPKSQCKHLSEPQIVLAPYWWYEQHAIEITNGIKIITYCQEIDCNYNKRRKQIVSFLTRNPYLDKYFIFISNNKLQR